MVGMTGFEPATPSTPYLYATGLRHIPTKIRAFARIKTLNNWFSL